MTPEQALRLAEAEAETSSQSPIIWDDEEDEEFEAGMDEDAQKIALNLLSEAMNLMGFLSDVGLSKKITSADRHSMDLLSEEIQQFLLDVSGTENPVDEEEDKSDG